MELAKLLDMTVTELHAHAQAENERTGDWYERQLLSASLSTAPGVVPNSGQSRLR